METIWECDIDERMGSRCFRVMGRACLAGMLVFFHVVSPVSVAAGATFFPPDEEFGYDVQFLGFFKAGQSQIKIRRVSGIQYEAQLVAETTGIVGFFTRYRKNSYMAEMEFIPGKGRLVTHRFTKTVTWGDEIRKSVSETDYKSRKHRWVVTENGKVKDEGSKKIPDGVVYYEDLLSIFFNLRYGAFGPLTPGRRIKVITQPFSQAPMGAPKDFKEDFIRKIEIRIADTSTEREFRSRFGRSKEKGLLIFVNVPSDFFGQNKGEIMVWFDEDMIPLATTVEDVFLFGDVTGELREVDVNKLRGSMSLVSGHPVQVSPNRQ